MYSRLLKALASSPRNSAITIQEPLTLASSVEVITLRVLISRLALLRPTFSRATEVDGLAMASLFLECSILSTTLMVLLAMGYPREPWSTGSLTLLRHTTAWLRSIRSSTPLPIGGRLALVILLLLARSRHWFSPDMLHLLVKFLVTGDSTLSGSTATSMPMVVMPRCLTVVTSSSRELLVDHKEIHFQ